MAAKSTRSGLVSYTGDSEISDSEDERGSISNSPPPVPLAASSLGIPPSEPHLPTTPPSFIRPIVHTPAPSTGLVDYSYYDEDDHNESKEDSHHSLPVFDDATRQQDSVDPMHSRNEELPVIEITDEQLSSKESEEMDTPLFLQLRNVQLPPEPVGQCSAALQEKIKEMLQKKAMHGYVWNERVQQNKGFRNPSIYEKLVQLVNLDEFGSNFPNHLFDPHEFGEESNYKNLLAAQKKAYEKKEKAKLDRTKVEFVTATKRPAPVATATMMSSSGGGGGQEAVKKPRRSKWDVGTDSGGSRGASPVSRAPLLGVAPSAISSIGAQARAQASQLNKDFSRLAK